MDTSHFGEAEAQRRAEIHAQRKKAARAKSRERIKTGIFTSLRRGFSLFVMMAAVYVAYTHQEEIQKFVSSKVTQVVGGRFSPSPGVLRQSALNHENEVNQIGR